MKQYVDMEATWKEKWLVGKKIKNRLLRYWGTETIQHETEGPVEVFKRKFPIYPNPADSTKTKILTLLGIRDTVINEDYDGIASTWLWFNPTKAEGLDVGIIADRINDNLELNTWYTASMTYTTERLKTFNSPYVGLNRSELIDYIGTNYNLLMEDDFLDTDSNGGVQQVTAMYVLTDTENLFEVEVTNAIAKIGPNVSANYYMGNPDLTIPAVKDHVIIALKFRRINLVSSNTEFVNRIVLESSQTMRNKAKAVEVDYYTAYALANQGAGDGDDGSTDGALGESTGAESDGFGDSGEGEGG